MRLPVLPISEFWRGMIGVAAWGIALAWCWRTAEAVQSLPGVADLRLVEWDLQPPQGAEPTLVVVVPARNEEASLGATIDALMLTDYQRMRVLVIDDRSTDKTGTIMDEAVARFARTQPGRLSGIHITELPDGWLGKTFALTVATENSESDYVLYTDADVLMSPSVLRRALAYAQSTETDHLVVMPTPQVKLRGEGIVLGFLQVVGMWAARPWRVADPKAKRDVIGVGAFNLVRREALKKIGGWAPQRLAVLEDVTLGRRMKAAGLQQRVAFAPGLVLVHWASGMLGVVRVMSKNMFSAFNFRPVLLLVACAWIVAFCLAPLAGVAWWMTLVPSVIVLCCVGATYRVMGEVSGIDARYGWLYPVGAVVLMYAMLRSMVMVWVRRGVVWRGTFYPLRDLRRHNSPFQWKPVKETRNEQMQAELRKRRGKGKR
jgi:glycosyltransferase involved in cell wall biosynthesis